MSEGEVERKGHRLEWPKIAKKRHTIENYEDMLTLEVSKGINNWL
jgi:hypothetical protein